MFNAYNFESLVTSSDWKRLARELDPGVPNPRKPNKASRSDHLAGVLASFRNAGAVSYIREEVYIDRDFVQAYASFFHKTHRLPPKHCSRIHFFAIDVVGLDRRGPVDRASWLENEGQENYLGFTVIRPVRHAPVSWALVSADAIMSSDVTDENLTDVLIRSTYEVHLLGARLRVSGAPVSEQDSRTGSCAQASIWSAARHLHKRYGEPWRSVVDITNAALTPTDADIATQLPHGSGMLSRDSMVRAMKNLGMHPVVYSKEKGQSWYEPPHRIVARYLDSGIPVIVGMERIGKNRREEQHAVLAVGLQGYRRIPDDETDNVGPTTYDGWTHMLVNDDQHGPYKSLAIADRNLTKTSYDWCLEDATFIMVTLPDGVYMKPEAAETVARDRVKHLVDRRDEFEKLVSDELTADDGHMGIMEDREPTAERLSVARFDKAGDRLIARTYLTPGWKYAERMLRNTASDPLKEELVQLSLSKHVYVTEFSLPEDVRDRQACKRRVRAHVVVDCTAETYEDPPISHIPGMLVIDDEHVMEPAQQGIVICIIDDDTPYYPKVRGWQDYRTCDDGGSLEVGDARTAFAAPFATQTRDSLIMAGG